MSEDQAMDERMRRLAEMREDPALDLSLDANAIGGLLAGIFGADVTGSDGQRASCHTVSFMGTDPTFRMEHNASCRVSATYVACSWPDAVPREVLLDELAHGIGSRWI